MALLPCPLFFKGKNMARRRAKKREITLMTLLAYDATASARELLKKHNVPDATNVADLEKKLSDLYLSSSDKIALEKELANLHPHKNWLIQTLDLIEKSKQPEQEQSPEDIPAPTKVEVGPIKRVFRLDEPFAEFSGEKQNTMVGPWAGGGGHRYIELVALVGVIGLCFYMVKNK